MIENISVKNNNISWTWSSGREAEVSIYAGRWDVPDSTVNIHLGTVRKQKGIAVSSMDIPQEKVTPGIYRIILSPRCEGETAEEIVVDSIPIGGICRVVYGVSQYDRREPVAQITFYLNGAKEVPGDHFRIRSRKYKRNYPILFRLKDGCGFLMYGVSSNDIEVVTTAEFKGCYKLERRGM